MITFLQEKGGYTCSSKVFISNHYHYSLSCLNCHKMSHSMRHLRRKTNKLNQNYISESTFADTSVFNDRDRKTQPKQPKYTLFSAHSQIATALYFSSSFIHGWRQVVGTNWTSLDNHLYLYIPLSTGSIRIGWICFPWLLKDRISNFDNECFSALTQGRKDMF